MSAPVVIGLDLSLRGTGLAGWDGATHRIVPRSMGPERLDLIERDVLVAVNDAFPFGSVFVAMEGYSFASQGRAMYGLGELGGVVRLALWRLNVPYTEVTPSQLKKYATGKGTASKYDVRRAAEERLGVIVDTDDEADASWLRAMALDALGVPLAKVPKVQRAVIDGLTWTRHAAVTS